MLPACVLCTLPIEGHYAQVKSCGRCEVFPSACRRPTTAAGVFHLLASGGVAEIGTPAAGWVKSGERWCYFAPLYVLPGSSTQKTRVPNRASVNPRWDGVPGAARFGNSTTGAGGAHGGGGVSTGPMWRDTADPGPVETDLGCADGIGAICT